MTKTLLVLCALLTAVPALSDDGDSKKWVLYGGNQKTRYYLRLDDAVRYASSTATDARIWTKTVTLPKTADSTPETMIQYSLDCTNQAYRILSALNYNAQGIPETIKVDSEEVNSIVPDSVTDSLRELICHDYNRS